MNDHVVIVDTNDQPLGTADKMTVHREGWLHRALSVFGPLEPKFTPPATA